MADPETWTIDTFHQLLKRGAFTTIDVWPWVYDCILHASLPLYHPIATLIREYVNSIFTFPNITRIPEDKISPLFSGDVTAPITPPQVLMLLYVVCYNEGVLGARSAEAKLGSSATGHREGRKHGAQPSSSFLKSLLCVRIVEPLVDFPARQPGSPVQTRIIISNPPSHARAMVSPGIQSTQPRLSSVSPSAES
ncbi:hypothetical protein BC938DRAFT_479212 [Jimgerdemannia flammicorona]|uniref:Uncharacterized protein n=1 Tax=Jimgerdemannia flammicorona TaxID=994334 RepID=A0A433QLD7_9FUNG|nr:hypothetical protein BC938DRAFT_479212 [Jimgerdemannia flammicorona]